MEEQIRQLGGGDEQSYRHGRYKRMRLFRAHPVAVRDESGAPGSEAARLGHEPLDAVVSGQLRDGQGSGRRLTKHAISTADGHG